MNYVKQIIKAALKEDIGMRDITTEFFIPKDKYIKAVLLAKENFVVCGMDIAKSVFKALDKNIQFKAKVKDGKLIKKGRVLAVIKGKARPILTAERVALNFLSLLSGIATKAKEYVDKVKPYKLKIMDTRKTIPGLRKLEKYAVRIGGGYNHRMQLDEMVLIKDNHLKVARGLLKRVAQEGCSRSCKVEIEVKNLKEFKETLKLRTDIIMLDNMSINEIKKAVQLRNRRSTIDCRLSTKLEASGGINLKNVRKIAACGVDMISIGGLTASVNSVDICLEAL